MCWESLPPLRELHPYMMAGEFAKIHELTASLLRERTLPLTSAMYFVDIGLAHYFQSHFKSARRAYERALSVQPDQENALRCLCYLLACCPDPAFHDGRLAVGLASRFRERSKPGDWSGMHIEAAAHARDGNFERALELVTMAATYVPPDAAYRNKRLRDLFEHGTPFTGNVADDFRRFREDALRAGFG